MSKTSIETATIRDLLRLWNSMSAIASTAVLGEAGQSFGYVTETASRICNEADEVRREIRDELRRRPVEGMTDGERCWRTQIIMSYAADSGDEGWILQDLISLGTTSLARAAA